MTIQTRTRRAAALFLAASVLVADSSFAQAPQHGAPVFERLIASDWQRDLAALATEVPKRHPNAFKYTPRATFDAAVVTLDKRMPELSPAQRIIELMRIVALVRDGHTSLSPFFQGSLGFHRLPLRFIAATDGLLIDEADVVHRNLVGARVVRVGRMRADSALAAAAALTSAENEQYARHWGSEMLAVPEVLHALGMSDSARSVVLELESAAGVRSVRVATDGLSSVSFSHETGAIHFDSAWVDVSEATGGARPLSRRKVGRTFGVEWIDAGKSVYARYDQVRNAPDETVAQFASRVTQMVASHPAEKLILDLRDNGGGNDFLNRSLVRAVVSSPLNARGSLFVLIGPNTFSAAHLLVTTLERYTDAIFIGEPTGQRINFFGDPAPFALPNSGITIAVSSVWWQLDQRDARPWKTPDIFVPMAIADYRAGRDRVLDEALAWRPSLTIRGRIEAAARRASPDLVVDTVRAVAGDPRNRFASVEADVNAVGYALLNTDPNAAVRAFRANTVVFPRSANAFDSLGDGLRAMADTAGAIAAYRRALELDASMTSSRNAIDQLTRARPF